MTNIIKTDNTNITGETNQTGKPNKTDKPNTNNRIFGRKRILIIGFLSLVWWALTFITDKKIFTDDPLNMSSLPIDTDAVFLMQILSKMVLLGTIVGILCFISYGIRHRKLLFAFGFYFVIYLGILLLNYPGYFMSDDTIIFGYATRYYPVYWHNYLTSIYYMTGLSLFPASTGPIILNDLILAMVFSYIFFETDQLYTSKVKYIIAAAGLFPFALLSASMCFRPVLYAPFFLFFFAFLFFEKQKKASFSIPKSIMLSLLTALLCFWRSEGIVLILFCFVLIPTVYGLPKKTGQTDQADRFQWKQALCFLLVFIITFSLIKIPQTDGEKKYYGSDYLIISTIRPLSLIIHREQTYPGAKEDLANIDAVIDLDYISYETLSCSSYNRYNSDHNSGHFTETGADADAQKAFLKSAVRLIWNNLDLYIAERLQLLAVTNGYYDYNPAMVMNLKPVTTSEFLSFQADREYGKELVNGNARWHYESNQNILLFLFDHGGEAYLIILFFAGIFILYTLAEKKLFYFFAFASLIAREAVIFLTAPASFIQYNYPMMFVTVFLLLVMFVSSCENGFFRSIKDQLSKAASKQK